MLQYARFELNSVIFIPLKVKTNLNQFKNGLDKLF